ncbi:MAG: hypothetical protein EON59_02130 [Alphaproteobacteria bacterium]|nr:MAG: hypothetical protein EON59_02130 [Alphaproteobacteria bacterium]
MRVPVLLLALAAAGPALAQEPGEDWDLTTNAERQLTLATLDFGDNVLALRCQAGTLDLLLTGVPVSTGATRTAVVSAGAIADESQIWTALSGQPVIGADEPARLARQLRAGGLLDVRLAPEGATDRPRRYQLTAPPSANAVNAVLTACGHPLDEPRDLIARISTVPGPTWAYTAAAEYPVAAVSRNLPEAVVRLSCIVGPELQPQDCLVESETPTGFGFGAAAASSAERSRLAPPADGSDLRGRLLRYKVRFRLGN